MSLHFEAPKTITAGVLLNRQFNKRPHIIDPWLRQGETAIIWAPSGVGKTMLALSIACVVAGGGQLGDWQASSPSRVLYIDGEMHLEDIQERIRILVATGAVKVADLEAMHANLTFVSRQAQEPMAPFYDVTDPEHQQSIVKTLRTGQFDLVIVDNLATTSDRLKDENDAVAFKSVQAFFLSLKQGNESGKLVASQKRALDYFSWRALKWSYAPL